MPVDLGVQFEEEGYEAFLWWKEKQLLIATDPQVIADLTAMTVEIWLRRILRPIVYETLGQKRANINNPYIIPLP